MNDGQYSIDYGNDSVRSGTDAVYDSGMFFLWYLQTVDFFCALGVITQMCLEHFE
jgi:hypothetical protein